MSQSTRSNIWEFYEINAVDERKANCLICNEKLKRGGNDPRSFGTTGLINHLRSKHPDEFKEYSAINEASKKRKLEDGNEKQSSARKKSMQMLAINRIESGFSERAGQLSGEEKDEELETEFQDFKTVLPDFTTDCQPRTPTFGDSVHWNGSRHLDTEMNSSIANLDLPSVSNGTVRNKKTSRCSTKSQDMASLSHSSHSGLNLGVSGGSTGTGCRNCLGGQTSDVLMQLKLINMKLQIQEECLAKIQSSVETMQQVSQVSKYKPASKPDVVCVILRQTVGTDVQKCFLLDNHRLHLNAIKEAFNLASVELLVDGDPCVLHAGVDGFIPLSFSPNESIFITGEPATRGSKE